MDISTLGALASQVGVPSALLIFFVIRDYQSSKEHKADLRDTVTKAVTALDKSTDAINDSARIIERDTVAFSENTHVLSDVKQLLSQRGTRNDRSI